MRRVALFSVLFFRVNRVLFIFLHVCLLHVLNKRSKIKIRDCKFNQQQPDQYFFAVFFLWLDILTACTMTTIVRLCNRRQQFNTSNLTMEPIRPPKSNCYLSARLQHGNVSIACRAVRTAPGMLCYFLSFCPHIWAAGGRRSLWSEHPTVASICRKIWGSVSVGSSHQLHPTSTTSKHSTIPVPDSL